MALVCGSGEPQTNAETSPDSVALVATLGLFFSFSISLCTEECPHVHSKSPEYEVSGAVEREEEQYKNLCEDYRESTLPDSYNMAALKMILCGGIRKSVQAREKVLKTYETPISGG